MILSKFLFCLLFLWKDNFPNVALWKPREYINVHSYLLRELWLLLKLSRILYFYTNTLFKIPNITMKSSRSLFLSSTLYKNIVIKTRYITWTRYDYDKKDRLLSIFYQGRDKCFMTSIYSNTFIKINPSGLPFTET